MRRRSARSLSSVESKTRESTDVILRKLKQDPSCLQSSIPKDVQKEIKKKVRKIGVDCDKTGGEVDVAADRVLKNLEQSLSEYIRLNGESFSVRITGPDGGKSRTIKRGRCLTGVLKIKLKENAFDQRYTGNDYFVSEADSKWKNIALESKDIVTTLSKMVKNLCELSVSSLCEANKLALRAIFYLLLKAYQYSSRTYEWITGRSLDQDLLHVFLKGAKFISDGDYDDLIMMLEIGKVGTDAVLELLEKRLKRRLGESIDALQQARIDFLEATGLGKILTWIVQFYNDMFGWMWK